MTLVVPNASEVSLVEFMLGKSTPNNQELRLFVNNKTPGDTDVAADYTQMSTQGYAAKTLTKGSWTVASSSNVGTATYAAQTWNFNGSGGATTVYGYYVVDSVSGLLLWAEAFNSPKLVQYSGDQITVTPTFTGSKA